MNQFRNRKKDSFLKSIPTASLDSDSDCLSKKCKFNFAYMDFNQPAGQKFKDWSQGQLSKLLDKLHSYSKETLKYWTNERIGSKANKVLEIYGNFPKNSEFTHPKHVPHQVTWARFRLESSVRLIGFVLPQEYDKKKHPQMNFYFDCNTFYVVFLDANHKFYII